MMLKCETCEAVIRVESDPEELPVIKCFGVPVEDPYEAENHGEMVLV